MAGSCTNVSAGAPPAALAPAPGVKAQKYQQGWLLHWCICWCTTSTAGCCTMGKSTKNTSRVGSCTSVFASAPPAALAAALPSKVQKHQHGWFLHWHICQCITSIPGSCTKVKVQKQQQRWFLHHRICHCTTSTPGRFIDSKCTKASAGLVLAVYCPSMFFTKHTSLSPVFSF